MTKIKKFITFINENINADITLYHGALDEHKFNYTGNLQNGTFFTPSKIEAKSYGKYLYEVKLNDNLVIFDTMDLNDCKKLFDEFDVLYDTYHDSDDTQYLIDTPEKLNDMNDNWECIEHTRGVLDWIESQYDGVWLTEGGVKNLLLFKPIKEKLKSIKLIS